MGDVAEGLGVSVGGAGVSDGITAVLVNVGGTGVFVEVGGTDVFVDVGGTGVTVDVAEGSEVSVGEGDGV